MVNQRQKQGMLALPLILSLIWPYAAVLLAGVMAPAAAQAVVGDALCNDQVLDVGGQNALERQGQT